MNRCESLADRIREVYLDGKWVANTNVQMQIKEISWVQATQTPHDCNSIAALTFHLNYYLSGLLHAFDTGKLEIKDKFSFDASPILSEEDWSLRVNDCLRNAERLALFVEKLQEEDLDAPFIDVRYGSMQRNIEAVIEHSYYHLGQMSLIRKIISHVPPTAHSTL